MRGGVQVQMYMCAIVLHPVGVCARVIVCVYVCLSVCLCVPWLQWHWFVSLALIHKAPGEGSGVGTLHPI